MSTLIHNEYNKESPYNILVNVGINQVRKRGKKNWTKHEQFSCILSIAPIGEVYHNKVRDIVQKYFPGWNITGYAYNDLKEVISDNKQK